MGVWTKPPVKAEPKQEAPAPSPAPAAPQRRQEAPPAPKPPPAKAPAPTRAAPYQAPPSTPPAAKTTAPGVGTREGAPDFELKGSSFPVAPPSDDFVLRGSSFTPVSRPPAEGFKAGTAPGTPERAAAIREEQQRVSLQKGDTDDARAAEVSGPLEGGRRLPEAMDDAAIRMMDAEVKLVDKKSEFLGAAQRILSEQAHLDILAAEDKMGVVTAPALLARKRTELAARYPAAIKLNVPLLVPRTDDENAHPTVKAFVAADAAGRIELRRRLQEAASQRQAAFAQAADADRPQAAFEFLQVALLRDAIEDEARRQRAVQ